MKAALKKTMLRQSPFIASDGGINIKDLAKALNIDQATVASASGSSRQIVSQHFKAKNKFIKIRNKNAHDFWAKLNQIYTLLLGLTDSERSSSEIKEWFNSPNQALNMERPIDLIRRNEHDILIKKLMDIINAAHGG